MSDLGDRPPKAHLQFLLLRLNLKPLSCCKWANGFSVCQYRVERGLVAQLGRFCAKTAGGSVLCPDGGIAETYGPEYLLIKALWSSITRNLICPCPPPIPYTLRNPETCVHLHGVPNKADQLS